MSDDPEKHILDTPDYKGWYIANSQYRKAGHQVISGDAGRKKVYQNKESVRSRLMGENGTRAISKPRPYCEPYSDTHVARYLFDHEPNFRRGRAPYINQAHHLIPTSYLNRFPHHWQREVLKRVDYDINNGRNIMFLPAQAQDSWFHLLPRHQSKHPRYTKVVASDAAAMSRQLEKYKNSEPCKEKDELGDSILKSLHDKQNDYWDLLKGAFAKGALTANAAFSTGKSSR